MREAVARRGRLAVLSLLPVLLAPGDPAAAAPTHRCAGAATEQAAKLLAFHFGSDTRAEIDGPVKRIVPLSNPADRKQVFDVLEVWAGVYKGRYRMRFIYARLPGDCILMGQEILEYARL